MKPIEKYEAFHGRTVRSIRTETFHVPDTLIFLGSVHAIEYVSNKFNGGGDGRKAIYRHKFSKGAKLYMDERGAFQLYIKGSKIRVNNTGIRN
jgi:hypothetical protein